MNHALESHRLFPYIAWGLVIGFALFTYNLTITVQKELEEISEDLGRLETKIDTLEVKDAAQKPI